MYCEMSRATGRKIRDKVWNVVIVIHYYSSAFSFADQYND